MTIEEIDPRLRECFLFYGDGNSARQIYERLVGVHHMTDLNAQQLVVDEMKAGHILLTEQLTLWLA